MRITVVAAICLCIVGISTGANAQAAIRKETNIPAQGLGPALQVLAKDRNLQMVYRSEVIGKLRTEGAAGDLTTDEAVTQLLKGTGLTYRYLEDNAITIVPIGSGPDAGNPPSSSKSPVSTTTNTSDQPPREGKKSFWDNFRLAQANQGIPQRSSTVGGDVQSSPENSEKSPQLTEILVTAQKQGAQRLQDVPIPITVVNTQTLIDNNQTRIQDFFSSVPGLTFSSTGADGAGVLSIRGISTGIGTNPTVGVLVDDVPYGSVTDFGTGTLMPDIDPNDLARIEVLRGPQGTLYGSSSMGGLLKYVTKDPSFDAFSGSVSAGLSSVYNGAEAGYNARASANIPLGDTLAVRVSGFTRQDPGYIDNPFLHVDGINEDHTNGGHLAMLWKPSDAFSLRISALYQDIRADGSFDVNSGPGYVSSLGTLQPGNPTGPLGDLQQDYYPGIAGFRGLGGYERTVQAYSGVMNAKLGSVDLTSVTGFSVNHYNDTWDFTPGFGSVTASFFNGTEGTPVTDSDTTRKITQEIRLSSSLGQFDWLFGGFFEHEHTPALENIYAENTGGNIVGTWANWFFAGTNQEEAAFADLTYHFTNRFDVQVGGRESHIVVTNNPNTQSGLFNVLLGEPTSATHSPEESTNANVFTYLFTPSFKLSDNVMAYTRIASGYRPGASNGKVPLSSSIPAQSNPDKTVNYELGLKGDFLDHKLSLDGSVYYIDWMDLQALVTDPVTHFPYTGNAGKAKSEGVELTLTTRPLTGLTVSAWVSYDDAVLTQPFPPGSQAYGVPGTRLAFSSRWSGSASFQQDFPLSGALTGFVGGQASLVGDRLGNFAPNSATYRQDYPGYTKVDLRGGSKFNLWTLSLYANNVCDRRGLIGGGAGAYPPIGYQYITPRTVGLNVSRAF